MRSLRLSLALLTPLLATPPRPLLARGVQVTIGEERPGLLAKAKVTPDAATKTARARFPKARITSAEIEEEGGKLIYSFDLRTDGKSGIDEVNVDATNGDIVSADHESPRAEAKEKAADAKKPAPQRK